MKNILFLLYAFLLFSFLFLTEACQESEEIDPCLNVICQNEGTCEDGLCACPEGFLGNFCESVDTSKIQFLLDRGITPMTLYENGVTLNELYGKIYADGLIFYLNTDDGRGLVAAVEDQDSLAEWGCDGTDIIDLPTVQNLPADPETDEGTRIFDGKTNTTTILAGCISNDGIAANLCRDLGDDWFLPSRAELNLMYTNLYIQGHGNFAADYYWTSTENGSISAWHQDFQNGEQTIILKNSTVHVRAARAF